MSGDPHIGFIVAAYLVTAIVMVGLVAAVVADGRAQRRALSRLEHDRRSGGVER